jgi:taurine dioxygenase
MSVQTPSGSLPQAKVLELFEQTGFDPPAGMPLQQAFNLFMELMEQQMQKQQLRSTPARGRTAVTCKREDVSSILSEFGASYSLMEVVGAEVTGVDLTKPLDAKLAGAVEILMADAGFVLFRKQGTPQKEMGIEGKYLTGSQQCEVSLAFGAGALHSTHGNHDECPNRDIFRLSNDPNHGFNEVGPEWHNDGSFERKVFSHVVYHIIKAPNGPGNTSFAHLGKAFDALPVELQERYSKCASVNSNSGVVHPMVHKHHLSARKSLYLHTGMTGSIIERVDEPTPGQRLSGIKAWNHEEMNEMFCALTELLDRKDISYSHKWEEGDVIIIDNQAIAHKAMPGAHVASSGLRILHRTTIEALEPLDPAPSSAFPLQLEMTGRCPFNEPDAVWIQGYVGFRWGDWKSRSRPS